MDDIDFHIPCANYAFRDEAFESVAKANVLFASNPDFLKANDLEIPKITNDDRREAVSIFYDMPDAPDKPTTAGAALMLNRMLKKYDYALDDPISKMRNYVMFKFFELAESDDPKTSMRALENLAKTADIGLFSERVEININQKTTVDLEKDLSRLIQTALQRELPPVIDASKAEDAKFV